VNKLCQKHLYIIHIDVWIVCLQRCGTTRRYFYHLLSTLTPNLTLVVLSSIFQFLANSQSVSLYSSSTKGWVISIPIIIRWRKVTTEARSRSQTHPLVLPLLSPLFFINCYSAVLFY
jgi:hypothetical protein